MSDNFKRLDPIVQKWVYKQGWEDLRDIQKDSIDPILSEQKDVIISASTASGKTEAAFLPACTAIAGEKEGFGILYISPLKALINDQYRRLETLCEMLDMSVTSWHGDSSQSKKKMARKNPQGILLITPESLESLFIREAGWVRESFAPLKFIIIDEYHSFIGSERGSQLQSLLYRLECLLNRQKNPIPRIALSATLGDMEKIPDCLRPTKSLDYQMIIGSQGHNLKLQLRGYIELKDIEYDSEDEFSLAPLPTDQQIAKDLYEILRGKSHLIFANSRKRTENFSAMLSDLCKQNIVPNEFFPHHGSLAKELRIDLEARLQKERLPTTAVCTMTLELGIDIGKVNSVAQVTAPHSVASLRQRLGRSGRRNEPSILRMFISENELKGNSSTSDKLRMELLQSIAMVRLLVAKWYEPADTSLFHFSTLLHQILAVTAQWGGVQAEQLWTILCESGTFNKVTIDHFKTLLSHMGEKRLISQISSGELVLAEVGEKLVDHYTFYAVFNTPEEFRIIYEGKTLGTLPVDSVVVEGQHIIFAGRRWKIKEVDSDKKVIYVISAKGGKPPKFGGGGMSLHNIVRQEMLQVYLDEESRIDVGGLKIEFLDSIARDLFLEGLSFFRALDLKNKRIINNGNQILIIPWMGSKIVNTLTFILRHNGYSADSYGGIIEITDADRFDIYHLLKGLRKENTPTNTELAEIVPDRETEKYDYLLPESLLNIGFGAKMFDVEGTLEWSRKLRL